MFKKSLNVFLRCLFASILCLMIIIMVSSLTNIAFTQKIGYRAYGTDNSGKTKYLYSYRYTDGKDKLQAEYEKKGYTINTEEDRSDLKGVGKAVNIILTEGISLALLFFFLHGILFSYGNKDANSANFGHIVEDKYKGLKIGLLGSVPYFAFYFVFALSAFGINKNFSIILFKVVNAVNFGFYKLILGDSVKVAELNSLQIVLAILPLFVVPIMTHISYTLGLKGISIGEKVVYKKKGKE